MLSLEIVCLNPECRRVILTHNGTARKVKAATQDAPAKHQIKCPHCPAVYELTLRRIDKT